MDDWLPQNKYEHVPITAATGPGTMYSNYNWKFVLHSTEGPPGSLPGTISLFKANPGSCPHFIIDPFSSCRRVQCIPLSWSAAALRGGRNGFQTNRGRAIQMEICGYTNESRNWSDAGLAQIADVIADCIKAGVPINPHNVVDLSRLSGTLATENAPQRMSPQEFQSFDGICGHVNVPFNDHYDVAYSNTPRIGEHVRAILAGAGISIVPRPGTPMPPVPPIVQPGYMQEGMVGGQVRFLQELLKGLGYEVGPVDGVFGFATDQAVKKFQADKGLTADGVVGPQTCAAISQAYAPTSGKPVIPTPAPPASGAPAFPGRFLVLQNPIMQGGDVSTWQARMAARGWDLDDDGFYGQESYSTCKSFQAEKGLRPDGVVGPQTWMTSWAAPVS
jgi:peptidoglycan hydrolase-like protein with peptidoglycan-binding domain